jgi:hypothetical protein
MLALSKAFKYKWYRQSSVTKKQNEVLSENDLAEYTAFTWDRTPCNCKHICLSQSLLFENMREFQHTIFHHKGHQYHKTCQLLKNSTFWL